MTGAERQRRYRDRQREATKLLKEERERFVRLLRKSFVASGINLLQLHADEAAHAALREFLRQSGAEIDIVQIMEDAGKSAALEHYEREVALRMAPRQRRAVYRQQVRTLNAATRPR